MKHNNNDIKMEIINLCLKQRSYLSHFPKRENIPVYDVELDIEYNEDFAIWELEFRNV